MARLQYEITGDNSGLLNAVSAASAAINKLGSTADDTNVSLQFKNGIAALDNLSKQLLVTQGNASLFGDSLKNQTQEIGAYQSALNSLLANGFEPMDADVQRLKTRIDDLNASIKATPKTISIQGDQTPADSIFNPNLTGSTGGNSGAVSALNAQLAQGAITAQQYNEALAGANSTTGLLGQTAQQTAQQVEVVDGYIQGLKQALVDLNAQRTAAASIEDLKVLNAEIQETEVALQQAGNIGKQGFDQFGNAIKGVSVQNLNGQLVALNNNLFGARLIAKDVVRTFDSNSIAGFAKALGLLAVDFLYYAQSAQFATTATATATVAIEGEAVVAGSGALSTAALGAAFGALLTPLNLVILAVALAGGGLLAYERSQKSAAQAATEHLKAIQAQKQALADYLTTLNSSQQVQAAASDTNASAIIKLNELYYAVKNNTGAIFDGKSALDDLQTLYPAFFANIDTAKSKTDALTIAYNGAKDALKALGLFTAANNLAEKSTEDATKNQVAADSLIPALAAAQKKLADFRKAEDEAAKGTQFGQGNSFTVGISNLQKNIDSIRSDIDKYNTAVAVAGKQTQAFYDIANKNAPKAGLTTIKPDKATTKDIVDPFNEIQDSINGIISKTNQLNNNSGLTGYAEEVEKISKSYDDLNQQIQKVITLINKDVDLGKLTKAEGSALTNLLNAGTAGIPGNENAALNQAKVTQAQKTADEIQAINDSFAIKARASQAIELQQVEKLADDKIAAANKGVLSLEEINAKYDSAIKNANGNQDLIDDAVRLKDAEVQQATDAAAKVTAIKTGEYLALTAIQEKYFQQEQDLYAKIAAIDQQATDEQDTNRNNDTARINKTFADRIATVNSYFEKLKSLVNTGDATADGVANGILAAQKNKVLTNLTADQKQQIQLSIAKPLIDGIDQAANNFYTTLTQINQQTDQSFKAIFSNLTKSLETSLNSVFLNVVELGLKNALQDAIKNGTSTLFNKNGSPTALGAGIAAAGLAGGLISGATPATSVAGQGAGGLLSGAATGAAVGTLFGPAGTVVGGVIGGAVGLLSGIFSANKAQKELQAQQLEEQKEQTALLKASLAYTATIIGRDTANGVITNISVGATGQLIATVSGSQLQFVLDRNAKTR